MIQVKPFPPHMLIRYGAPWLQQPLAPSPRRKKGSWVKVLHRRLEATKKAGHKRRGNRGGRKKRKSRKRWVQAPWAKKKKRRRADKRERWWQDGASRK